VFGQVGLLLALVGILFAVAAPQSRRALRCLQHGAVLRLALGKRERPAAASRFTLAWVIIFALAFLVVMTGYDR